MPPPDSSLTSGTDGALALVMSGGGARAAYQAGLVRTLAQARPELALPILTGVSAGAINAAYLAGGHGDLARRSANLCELWRQIRVGDVFEAEGFGLFGTVASLFLRLASGGRLGQRERQGMVSTEPLGRLLSHHLGADASGTLPGIKSRIQSGDLRALAVTGSSYATGASVTWVQGASIDAWQRPNRIAIETPVRLEHILASSSLPLLFPPVEVEGAWYGDGGVRLTAPLAPAIHLGATRILAVSTRYTHGPKPRRPAPEPHPPPPALVAGSLLNAIFLDLLDTDALNLTRINRLIAELPPEKRGGLRPIDLAVVRPSRDLGRLANEYEACLPRSMRFLTRGWGTKEVRSNDLLSLIMFQPDYLQRLIDLGEADALDLLPELTRFLDGERSSIRA